MSSLNPVFRELDKDTIHDTIRKVWERLSAQKEGFFLPRQNQPVIDVSVLHPDAATIFRLWQVYLDGVDPLFKVTHAPSLQARIVESASSIRDTDPSLQALMFSIYCIAIYSMPDDKCQATFASSRDSLLEMYHAACEQALMNCGFLNTDNRDCLTALFLYLLTLGYAVDPRSLFSISGICMRIAQRMQLDRELPNDKVTPFEAEMRRRLWWAIVVFDVRLSELVHYRPAALDPTWDCHIPLNVNDCDLHPQMKAAPSVQDSRPSEAIFCVVRGELGDFLRHAEYFLDLTNPSLRILARDRLKGRASASSQGADAAGDKGKDLDDTYKAERKIKEKYLHLCSPENSLHWMTMQTTRGFLARCRLVKFASRYSSESTEPTEIMRDAAFADALTVMECDTQIMTSPNTARFKWFTSYYFPLPAYVHICRDLVKRVKGELAVQAWQIMTENYESHFVSVTARSRSMHELLAQVILHMWDECQANFEDKTGSKPPHKLILKIRETMAEYEALCENRVDPVSSTDAILRPLSLPLDFNSSGNFYPMGTSQPSEFPMTTTPGIFSNPVSSTSTPLDFGLNNTCWPSNTPWAWRGPRPGW